MHNIVFNYMELFIAFSPLNSGKIVGLGIVLILNASSAALNNLQPKYWHLNLKQSGYISAFLDALAFTYTLKLAITTSIWLYGLVFVIARILGVYLGQQIEKRITLEILEIKISKELEEGLELAEYLRGKKYSISTLISYGTNGKERIMITITIPRSKANKLHRILCNSKGFI